VKTTIKDSPPALLGSSDWGAYTGRMCLCSNNSNDDDDDYDMSRNAENNNNNNNSSNRNLQQQKRRRSSLLLVLVLSLIAFIELISGATSVRRVSRVYELATDVTKRRQPLPLHNDHKEDVDELALMMSRAREEVLEDGLLGMSDGSSSKTNSLSFSCPMEPCGLSVLLIGDSLTRFQYDHGPARTVRELRLLPRALKYRH
jgi:hypothetical protein